MVPHVAARKTHQRLLKFSFVTPKRLLQQYLPTTEVERPIRSPYRRGQKARGNLDAQGPRRVSFTRYHSGHSLVASARPSAPHPDRVHAMQQQHLLHISSWDTICAACYRERI